MTKSLTQYDTQTADRIKGTMVHNKRAEFDDKGHDNEQDTTRSEKFFFWKDANKDTDRLDTTRHKNKRWTKRTELNKVTLDLMQQTQKLRTDFFFFF